MKLIAIRSQAQREMLRKCAADPVEARRRGMTTEQAAASLGQDRGHRLPERLAPHRANRHGARR